MTEFHSELKWLVGTSNALGNNIDLVQGTGGNVSVKLGDKMIVKVSGARLDGVKEGSGYVVVDKEKIASIYSGAPMAEDEAVKAILGSVIDSSEKPSIEAGFHSFLAKYVIHLHPVSMNVILCCRNGEEIISDIFSDTEFVWVPYTKVGHFLAHEIRKRWAGEELIFLQNHGVIVSSDSPDSCLEILENAGQRTESYLKSAIPDFYPFSYSGIQKTGNVFVNATEMALSIGQKAMARFLFPDAAVFAASEKIRVGENGIQYFMDYENARNVDEIISAHIYLHQTVGKLGEPRYFTEQEASELLGMEMEKHRRRLIGL